jgi:hypothetical protein
MAFGMKSRTGVRITERVVVNAGCSPPAGHGTVQTCFRNLNSRFPVWFVFLLIIGVSAIEIYGCAADCECGVCVYILCLLLNGDGVVVWPWTPPLFCVLVAWMSIVRWPREVHAWRNPRSGAPEVKRVSLWVVCWVSTCMCTCCRDLLFSGKMWNDWASIWELPGPEIMVLRITLAANGVSINFDIQWTRYLQRRGK